MLQGGNLNESVSHLDCLCWQRVACLGATRDAPDTHRAVNYRGVANGRCIAHDAGLVVLPGVDACEATT